MYDLLFFLSPAYTAGDNSVAVRYAPPLVYYQTPPHLAPIKKTCQNTIDSKALQQSALDSKKV